MSEYNLKSFEEEVLSSSKEPREKDILLVVRDQHEYVVNCVRSIQKWTKKYRLFIWDNGSKPETAKFLKDLPNVHYHREDQNQGFIVPNNRLVALGNSPYIILINSDVTVYDGWDNALTGWLEKHQECAQVGFLGAYLDENGKGVKGGLGWDVDYISGYCFCVRRSDYEQYGLFDEEHLKFAYCEDSDFSMRLREAGRKVYAIHLPLTYHFQNKTVLTVMTEMDISAATRGNQEYLLNRWRKYLPNQPVDIPRANAYQGVPDKPRKVIPTRLFKDRKHE